jgi:hypothetical protein
MHKLLPNTLVAQVDVRATESRVVDLWSRKWKTNDISVMSASTASTFTHKLLPNTLVAHVDVGATESRVHVTKMKERRYSSDELDSRSSLYEYMLLPVLRANVDGAPFEAIPDTVSHNDTLGHYVLMSESLRIRGSRSRRPNQMKTPHPLRYLTPRGSFPVISSSRFSRPEPMK